MTISAAQLTTDRADPVPSSTSPQVGSDTSFDAVLRGATYQTEGIISYDNFAAFTTERRSAGLHTLEGEADLGAGRSAAAAADRSAATNRGRLGDVYGGMGLTVVWDAAGDQRRTPGGGNPDEVMELIYELKALGVGDAERFWYGDANGGKDHITGFSLLNQLKLAVLRRGEALPSPAEYREIGRDMMRRGEELNLYPNGFLYGS